MYAKYHNTNVVNYDCICTAVWIYFTLLVRVTCHPPEAASPALTPAGVMTSIYLPVKDERLSRPELMLVNDLPKVIHCDNESTRMLCALRAAVSSTSSSSLPEVTMIVKAPQKF